MNISHLPLLSVVFLSFMTSPPAWAAGLQKARGVLEIIQAELTTIIPIVATLLLVVSGIAYAGRFIEKDTFVRWAIGLLIAGSAAQITSLFF